MATNAEIEGMDRPALMTAARAARINPAGKSDNDLRRELKKLASGGNSSADPNGAARITATVAGAAKVAAVAKPVPPVTAAKPIAAPPQQRVAAPVAPKPQAVIPTPPPQVAAKPPVAAPVAPKPQVAAPAPVAAPVVAGVSQEKFDALSKEFTAYKAVSEKKFSDLSKEIAAVVATVKDHATKLEAIEARAAALRELDEEEEEVAGEAGGTEEFTLNHETIESNDLSVLTAVMVELGYEIPEGMTLEDARATLHAFIDEKSGGEGEVAPTDPNEGSEYAVDAERRAKLIGNAKNITAFKEEMEAILCAPEDEGFSTEGSPDRTYNAVVKGMPKDVGGPVQKIFIHFEDNGEWFGADVPVTHLYPAGKAKPQAR
jgi:hypothetical protein